MTLPNRRFAASNTLATLLAAGASLLSAQTPPGRETSATSVASYRLEQPMPGDPEVLIGALPNGLQCYVRADARPAHRAELRQMNAGTIIVRPYAI